MFSRVLALSFLLCLPARALIAPLGDLIVERLGQTPLGLVQWEKPAQSERAVNFIVASEGYRSEELFRFPIDALRLKNTVMSISPWKENAANCNWWLLYVASNESGADKPGILKDTFFGAYYNDRNIRRLIGCDSDSNFKIQKLAGTAVPKFFAFLLVNDSEYGGGGGLPLTVSVHALSGWIGAHELGHGFANLGDEYKGGAVPWLQPNIGTDTNALPWATMIGTDGVSWKAIGDGRFRPGPVCLMQSLDARQLCPVCRKAVDDKIQLLVNRP